MNDHLVIFSTLALMLTIAFIAYFKLAPGKATLPTSISWNGKVNRRAPRLAALLQIPAIATLIMLLFAYLPATFLGEPKHFSILPATASTLVINQLVHLWLIHKKG